MTECGKTVEFPAQVFSYRPGRDGRNTRTMRYVGSKLTCNYSGGHKGRCWYISHEWKWVSSGGLGGFTTRPWSDPDADPIADIEALLR